MVKAFNLADWFGQSVVNTGAFSLFCGSGLAREGGGSVTPTVTAPPLSQASLLPQGYVLPVHTLVIELTDQTVDPSDWTRCIAASNLTACSATEALHDRSP